MSAPVTFHLLETTIDAMHHAYQSGQLTARQLVQMYIDRIAAYDQTGPTMNALITLNAHALDAADRLDVAYRTSGFMGPLHGTPVAVKDQADVAGLPTTLGSVLFRQYYPDRDGFVVEQLKRAGAIILGKSTLGELGGGDTHGSLFGSTRNPYDVARTVGGSSGGSAACVSANFATVGVGQEGFASIRRPATWTGIVGMRPTAGLVSRGGVYAGWPSVHGSLGPMARTVTDMATLLDVMSGYDPEDPLTARGVGQVPARYTTEQGNARCQEAITVLYSHPQTAIREVISTMRLEGKVALISGGARGQGATEARLFAREGAKVVIGDLLEEEGKRVEAEINASGGACLFVKLDVTQAEDWQQAVAAAVARFGTLHVLVNNAGIGSTRGPDGEPVTMENLTAEQWDRVMAVNAKGVFLGTKYAIPAMRKAGGGSIINISSIAGIVGGQTTAYGASKGAVRLLTKATAVQYAREGIRCNSVHPGVIETPMTARLLASEEGRQRSMARHPLGRLGQPEDVAYGVLYLAADESSFVTGSELVIDGGLTAQ